MDKTWQIEITRDGSSTLRWHDGDRSERMHHSGGAFAETGYIYGAAVAQAFASGDPTPGLRFVSVGLGLGYNELFIAAEALKTSRNYEIWSYESDEWLRQEFHQWICGETGELTSVYEDIAARLAIPSETLRAELERKLEKKEFHLLGALAGPEQIPADPTHYLWDAFSKKTSPTLWDEEFLKACLAKAKPGAVLVTYAYNGNLVRALKASGFTVEDREGFQGKRSATWACKR